MPPSAPVLVRDILHEDALGYGLVFAVAGLGGGDWISDLMARRSPIAA